MTRSEAAGDLRGVWPLFGIRLATPDLELRPATEGDIVGLVEILPDDLEQDPSATRYADLGGQANRQVVVAQEYWRAMGTWTPARWALPFVVADRNGDLLGMQWLEGPDFGADRVVDSASWLVGEARGRGLGTQMRAAILELAFRHLGAVAAVSSAVLDNAGSLGVSRSLGYRDTHTSVLEHSGATLQHLRLERDDWLRSGRGSSVRITGIDPALPLFERGDEHE